MRYERLFSYENLDIFIISAQREYGAVRIASLYGAKSLLTEIHPSLIRQTSADGFQSTADSRPVPNRQPQADDLHTTPSFRRTNSYS